MKNRKIVSLLLTGAMTAALLAVPAQAAEAPTTQPYTISADHWSREDYSQEADPSVFTGVYSRELYNTIRHHGCNRVPPLTWTSSWEAQLRR